MITRHRSSAVARALAPVLLGLVLASSCTQPAQPQADTPCETSSQCDGKLCVASTCRACGDALACQQDPAYGAGAACNGGSCVACKGQVDCACDGTSCANGSLCRDGVCRTCPVGAKDCACFPNSTCNGGLNCSNGVCLDCAPGSASCACLGDGGCGADLQCMDSKCVSKECQEGQLECPCRQDPTNACNEGLGCNHQTETCGICTPATAGCACAPDNTCQGGLVCNTADHVCRVSMTCQQVMCGTQQTCMAASQGMDAKCLPSCNAGYTWNATTMACDAVAAANCNDGAPGSILMDCNARNRACTPTATGAMCGACKMDFVDEDGLLSTCRAAIPCTALTCAAQHRVCVPQTTSVDASCGACDTGYVVDGTGSCVLDNTSNCRPDDPNSRLAECTALNKTCVDSGTGASCGDCVSGYAVDTSTMACVRRLCSDPAVACAAKNRSCAGEPLAACGACLTGFVPTDAADTTNTTDCRLPHTCAETSCPAGTQCLERVNQDPLCSAWPCVDAAGNAELGKAVDDATGLCIDCGLSCTGEGELRLWPTTANGQCICETSPGYYVELGGLYTARPCDEDNDGWVRIGAAAAITSGFDALVDNARCSLRTIDRFRLGNEFKQTLDVLSCAGGFVPVWGCTVDGDCGTAGDCNTSTGKCQCAGLSNPLSLYESTRNDDQATLNLQADTDVPPYAEFPTGSTVSTGRRLRASEVNPLTKACITATGDYNDNGADDLAEWQGVAPSGADSDTIAFTHFSYFVETHQGSYEKDVSDAYGRYVVQERSRCSADFPVKYSTVVDGTYWKQCVRNRDVDYNRNGANALAGYDFAEFSCTGTSGTCSTPEPATGTATSGAVTPHGLCETGVTLPPVDGVWRGMGHHSQFKCVQALSTIPSDRDTASPYKRLISELEDGTGDGDFQLNRCRISCPAADESCASDCTGIDACLTSTTNTTGNPDVPKLTCDTVSRSSVVDGEVGFVATRYLQVSGNYTRGCINEWQPASTSEEFTPWKNLCPGYSPTGGTDGAGHRYNFGKLLCGCTFNYGGASCNAGCVDEELHVGGDCNSDLTGYCPVDPDTSGRHGWWLCGAPTTSAYENTGTNGPKLNDSTNAWSVTGSVPADGVGREILSDSSGTWKVW